MRLHQQVRQARLDHGLSQMRLARLAGVPRSVIQVLEEGGNVTLETLGKVLAHLPNLKLATVRAEDIAALQRSIADFTAAAARLLEALGAGSADPEQFTQTEIAEAAEIDEEARAMKHMLETLDKDDDAS